MSAILALPTETQLQKLYLARLVLPAILLTVFWLWQTWRPLFGWRTGRWRHAGRNVLLGLINAILLGLIFGIATSFMAEWTRRSHVGLLTLLESSAARVVAGILLLDAWMYVWHRANHAIPLLWRFHRMHHSDNRMDVTSAVRFHIGELFASNALRLGLIPLLGLHISHVVIYELLLTAITQFHHADISLGRVDRILRWVIVTPDMHKLHHSRWRPETDSNYSTVFSWWDRIARSFRIRSNPETLDYGLKGFDDPDNQTIWGMLKTPFVKVPERDEPSSQSPAEGSSHSSTTTSLRSS